MPIVDPAQTGEPQCICGRIASKVHCPTCGSYNIVARGAKHRTRHTDVNTGQTVEVAALQCRRCGMYFDDYIWRNHCEAPAYVTTEMRKQVKAELDASKTKVEGESPLKDPWALGALNKLRVARGMKPLDSDGNEIDQ